MANTNQMRFFIIIDEKEHENLEFTVVDDICTIMSAEDNLMPKHLHGAHIQEIVQACAILNLTWVIVAEEDLCMIKVYF